MQQKVREGYESAVMALMSRHGGPEATRSAANEELTARGLEPQGGEGAGRSWDVGRIDRGSKYSAVPHTGGPFIGNWDGDIPAWAPKQYEKKGVKPAFLPRSQGGVGDTRVTYMTDKRLCVPNRETLSNRGMDSNFAMRPGTMTGRPDQHSYLNCHTNTVRGHTLPQFMLMAVTFML